MSTTVNMHEAKTHFARLVALALSGEEVIVAKAGKPQVKLVPVAEHALGKVHFGQDKGKVVMHDNFSDPVPDWEDLAS